MYFSEDQRWPTRSQRFGWVVAVGIAAFIVFELNLHRSAPLLGFAIMLMLVLLLLVVLTLQQRLVVRIGSGASGIPGQVVAKRFWQRATRTLPTADEQAINDDPVLRIDYRAKGPVSALSPGRRGARLGRRDRRIPLSEVASWSADRVPLFPRGDLRFSVGAHRDAVTVVLSSGERLTVPTQHRASFLEALSAAKVDSVKREREATAAREEI